MARAAENGTENACCHIRKPSGLGIFLVLLGAFFLLQEYGLIPKNLPVFPLVLIIAGFFLVITSVLG